DSGTWTPLPDLPVATSIAQAGIVKHPDGKMEIIVAAGRDTSATQIFSFETQTWRFGPEFPGGRLEGGASVPYEDTFVIVGGSIFGTDYKRSIYVYVIETGSWSMLPQELSIARPLFAAFFVP